MHSMGELRKPSVSPKIVQTLLQQDYGLVVEVGKELKSFSAQNYIVRCKSELRMTKLLAKIINAEEAEDELLETRIQVMDALRNHGFVCQKFLRSNSGRNSVPIDSSERKDTSEPNAVVPYKLCVLEFLEGTELFHLAPWQPRMLEDLGEWLAQLRKALQQMTVPSLLDESAGNGSEGVLGNAEWRLSHLSDLRRHYSSLEEKHRRTTEKVIKQFEETVVPVLDQLQMGLIHGDLHDENILLLKTSPSTPESDDVKRKFGLIDFEDIHYSHCIVDLSTALCYFMIASKCDDIMAVSGKILSGYTKTVTLTSAEWKVLFPLVCGRYIQELVLCQVEQQKQCNNDYLRTCFQDGWPQIEQLVNWGEDYVVKEWQKFL